jgi:hypothetical protein
MVDSGYKMDRDEVLMIDQEGEQSYPHDNLGR